MASRKQRKRNKAKVQKEREEAKATNVTAVPAQRTNNIEDDDQKQMKKTKNGNKETKSSFNINAPNFKLNKNYKSNNINDNMKTNETKKKASNYKKKSRNDDVNNNNNNNNNQTLKKKTGTFNVTNNKKKVKKKTTQSSNNKDKMKTKEPVNINKKLKMKMKKAMAYVPDVIDSEEDDNAPTCIVCTDKLKYVSLGPCNHNEVCSKCSLRSRVLLGNRSCFYCKSKQNRVVITGDISRTWESFSESIGGNYCFNELKLDKESGAFFHGDKHLKDTQRKLRGFTCNSGNCTNVSFNNLKDLTVHLQATHQLKICGICVNAKQKFVSELPRYTKKQLDIHIRKGNPKEGFNGHPHCHFCRTKFYGDDELFKHLHEKHFKCHVCDQLGKKNQYKRNYKELEDHFRRDHFICEQESCLEKRFVAFTTELALKAHMAAEHPYVKFERKIDLNIKYKSHTNVDEDKHRENNNNNNYTHEDDEGGDFNYNIAGERIDSNNTTGQNQLWHGAIGRNMNSQEDFPTLGGSNNNNNNNNVHGLAAQLSRTFGRVTVANDYYNGNSTKSGSSNGQQQQAPPAPQVNLKALKADFPSLPKSRNNKKKNNLRNLLGPKKKNTTQNRSIEMPEGAIPLRKEEDPLVNNGPEWSCISCTLINPSWKTKCAACGVKRGKKINLQQQQQQKPRRNMIPSSVMMMSNNGSNTGNNNVKRGPTPPMRTVTPPIRTRTPPFNNSNNTNNIGRKASGGLDLVTLVKRALDGDDRKFQSFQTLCRKYVAQAITAREYFMTVKRMFRSDDLKQFFPLLLETLPNEQLRRPLLNVFNESTNLVFQQQKKQAAHKSNESKFVKAKNTSNGSWPGLPASEKQKPKATAQLKWASSKNHIPKQPKSQWLSQNGSSNNNNKKSRKKKSQKTKELQNLGKFGS